MYVYQVVVVVVVVVVVIDSVNLRSVIDSVGLRCVNVQVQSVMEVQCMPVANGQW